MVSRGRRLVAGTEVKSGCALCAEFARRKQGRQGVLALCGRHNSSTHKVSSSSDRLGTVGSELALRTGCQDEYDQCVMTGSPRVLILHSV